MCIRDSGHTAVIVEHHLDVIRRADWVVDLGPGPGRRGGRVLYEGPVAGLNTGPTAQALHAPELSLIHIYSGGSSIVKSASRNASVRISQRQSSSRNST